jgi:hypothetical protein
MKAMRKSLGGRALAAALAVITAMMMACAALPLPVSADAGGAVVRADLEAVRDYNFDGFPTRYWMAKIKGKTARTAYCIQPSRVPDEGAGTARKMPDSYSISRAMYYCRGYQGWDIAESRLRKLPGASDWFGADAGYGYVLCHYILSCIYNSPSGEWDDGLTAEHAAFVRKAAEVVRKLPAPPDASVSVTPPKGTARWLADQSGYFSSTFKVNADKQNFITVKSPAGVVTYNRTTNKSAAAGSSIRIYGGQHFNFRLTDNSAGGKKFTFGPYTGVLPDYTAYKFNASENAQDIAFFALETMSSDRITVSVGTTGSAKLVKTMETRDGGRAPEKGAVFRVWNTRFGSFEEAAKSRTAYSDVITTDETGTAVTKKLVPGTYIVRQISGSKFHEFFPDRTFTIEAGKNGTVTFIGSPETNNDALMRMKLVLKKKDIFTGRDIRVKGAEFQIYDEDGRLVSLPKDTDDGVTVMCDTFVTDESGSFTTPPMKAGKYRIAETKAPPGYLKSPAKTIEISREAGSEQGVTVEGDTVTVDFRDAPQLGTINLRKRGVYTADGGRVTEDLPGVVFDVFALEDIVTGDGTVRARKGDVVRTVVTDEHGNASAEGLYLGRYGIREKAFLVGGKETNTYRNYLITGTEKVSEAVLAPAADKDTVVYDLVIENNGDHKIRTEAMCVESGGHYGVFGTGAGADGDGRAAGPTLTDVVNYSHLIPGEKYTLKAVLMDKKTGSPVTKNGDPVKASSEFVPGASGGVATVSFSADPALMAGKETVVFEKLYLGGKLVASHCDLSSESQTVKWPGLRTSALDAQTKSHTGAVGKGRITDTVKYSNVEPGREYTLKGVLMDKENGRELIIGGNAVKSEKSFTAGSESGTLTLDFDLDASALSGRDVVVFETLESGGEVIVSHTDINDAGQTVSYPGLSTEASDAGTGTHSGTVGRHAVLNDRVMYTNLVPGEKYTVSGVLMDKRTGKPVMADGKKITASRAFTAVDSEGSINVRFEADTTGLEGKDTVLFETLSVGGEEAAAHEDIRSSEQSISFPAGGARSPKTGDALPWLAVVLMLAAGTVAFGVRKEM